MVSDVKSTIFSVLKLITNPPVTEDSYDSKDGEDYTLALPVNTVSLRDSLSTVYPPLDLSSQTKMDSDETDKTTVYPSLNINKNKVGPIVDFDPFDTTFSTDDIISKNTTDKEKNDQTSTETVKKHIHTSKVDQKKTEATEVISQELTTQTKAEERKTTSIKIQTTEPSKKHFSDEGRNPESKEKHAKYEDTGVRSKKKKSKQSKADKRTKDKPKDNSNAESKVTKSRNKAKKKTSYVKKEKTNEKKTKPPKSEKSDNIEDLQISTVSSDDYLAKLLNEEMKKEKEKQSIINKNKTVSEKSTTTKEITTVSVLLAIWSLVNKILLKIEID